MVNYVNDMTCKRLSNILKYLCLYNLFIFSFIVYFTVSENYLVYNKSHYPIRMNINQQEMEERKKSSANIMFSSATKKPISVHLFLGHEKYTAHKK